MQCPYCGNDALLVGGDAIYPQRPDLYHLKYWLCKPCDAYVGTHRNSKANKPLGRLANAELRLLKSEVHERFDVLWKRQIMTRTAAYEWLADALHIPIKECHIGMFDEDKCKQAILAIILKRGDK